LVSAFYNHHKLLQWFLVRQQKCGTIHLVNSPKIQPYKMMEQYWLDDKQTFRLSQNTFKRLLRNVKNIFKGIFYTNYITS